VSRDSSARGPARWWWWPPASGILFALAYPPLDVLPLAILGLWPFLAFLDRTAAGERWGRVFAGGYLFGLAFYGALLYWVAGLTGFSLMAIPAYLAATLIMAFNGALVALGVALAVRRGVPIAVSFPLVWCGVEWLRSFGDLGFPWAMAGDALTAYPLLIQIGELGGGWLVGLWLVALATATWRLARPIRGRAVPAAVTIVLAVAVPLYGAIRLAALERAMASWSTIRVAAIQPNVPQDIKWSEEFERETLRRLDVLTRRAAERGVELIVWPESAVPGYLRYEPEMRASVTELAAAVGIPIYAGTVDADTLSGRAGVRERDYQILNAAYLIRPDRGIVPERYAKRRLVPVAERVPFLPGVATSLFERLTNWTGQFAPGESWPTWEVAGARFGALICYESVFPDVSRALVRRGADFLLNITNDAWFGPTVAPYQHASHLTLRAVEHRVPNLRAANTGITGWVDPLGRYRAETPLYTPAIVVAELPLSGITTPYTRWGDWAPFAAVLGWALLCLRRGDRRRR
jgi:apolipoprotein N-acyltransferase